jgi:hypothetical protein
MMRTTTMMSMRMSLLLSEKIASTLLLMRTVVIYVAP